MKIVHVTSGATQIFSYNLENTEQKEQLKIKDENAIGLKVVKQFGPLNLYKCKKLSHFMGPLNKLTIRIYQISSQQKLYKIDGHTSCHDQYKNEVTVEVNSESIKILLNSISVVTIKHSKDLISGSSTVLWPKIKLKKEKRGSLHSNI